MFFGRISDGSSRSRCLKKKSVLDTEKGHYCTLLCNTPVGGWVSPCAVSPLVVFPPAVCGGCAPLRSSDALVALLSCVHLLSLRASARQTWAGSSLADAGAPQLHALAPLQQRRWPAHRPAHVMVAARSSRPAQAQRREDFPRQRNTTRTLRPTRTPSPARPTRFRSRWPRS